MNKWYVALLSAVAGALLAPPLQTALQHIIVPPGLHLTTSAPMEVLWSSMRFRLAVGACTGLVAAVVCGLRRFPPARRWLIVLGPMLAAAIFVAFHKAAQCKEAVALTRELAIEVRFIEVRFAVGNLGLHQIPLAGLVAGLLAVVLACRRSAGVSPASSVSGCADREGGAGVPPSTV